VTFANIVRRSGNKSDILLPPYCVHPLCRPQQRNDASPRRLQFSFLPALLTHRHPKCRVVGLGQNDNVRCRRPMLLRPDHHHHDPHDPHLVRESIHRVLLPLLRSFSASAGKVSHEINSLSMRTKGAALGTATNWIFNFMGKPHSLPSLPHSFPTCPSPCHVLHSGPCSQSSKSPLQAFNLCDGNSRSPGPSST
jgi:hypothetical protein